MQGLIPILEIKGRKDYFASQLDAVLLACYYNVKSYISVIKEILEYHVPFGSILTLPESLWHAEPYISESLLIVEPSSGNFVRKKAY